MGKKKVAKDKMDVKLDGWANALVGLGQLGTDSRRSTRFEADDTLDQNVLTALYRCEGIARRIVDLPTGEITRKWIEIEGDEDGQLLAELARLNTKKSLRSAVKWSKLYGGSVIVLGIDDNGKFDMPVNEKAVRNLLFLRVYDRTCVEYSDAELVEDPMDPDFGLPQYYTITPVKGNQYRVHYSRLIVFRGLEVPDLRKDLLRGWGDSVYQPVYERIRALMALYDDVEIIAKDFVTSVISIQGLMDAIAGGSEKSVVDRARIMDMTKHVANSILIDADGEKHEKHQSSVTGIPDVIDRFVLAVSAATGIPVTLLMGQSPAGLNATGDNDVRNWYDKIASEQDDTLTEPLTRIIKLLLLSKDIKIAGMSVDKPPAIIYNPLWQLTQKEQVEIHKIQAEADAIYIDRGGLDPAEVTDSRFGGEHYSIETTLDSEARREPVSNPDDE